MLCAYDGSNMAPMAGRPLGAHTVLAGDLTALESDLRWQPPNNNLGMCTMVGGPQTNFLLALRPATGAPLWVYAARDLNGCERTTNGRFVSLDNSGAQFAASLAAGRWMPAPPPQVPSQCAVTGRFGQQNVLVPAGVVAARVCANGGSPGAGRTVRIADPSALRPLLNAVDRATTRPSGNSCAQIVDPETGKAVVQTFYAVVFEYPTGPAVRLSVADGCRPGLDNGNLQSTDAAPVLAAVEKLLG